MYSKNEIIENYRNTHIELTKLIPMIENNQDCISIHNQIDKVIHMMKKTKQGLMEAFVEKCMTKLVKDNHKGKILRNEIISLFKTTYEQ